MKISPTYRPSELGFTEASILGIPFKHDAQGVLESFTTCAYTSGCHRDN